MHCSNLRAAFPARQGDDPHSPALFPLEENPARCLRGARLRKNDRPKVDPFCMHDAETLIAAIHRQWGEAQGNYDLGC